MKPLPDHRNITAYQSRIGGRKESANRFQLGFNPSLIVVASLDVFLNERDCVGADLTLQRVVAYVLVIVDYCSVDLLLGLAFSGTSIDFVTDLIRCNASYQLLNDLLSVGRDELGTLGEKRRSI